MEDFRKHLASLQDGTNPISSTSIKLMVTRLLSDREKKHLRVSLLGKKCIFDNKLKGW